MGNFSILLLLLLYTARSLAIELPRDWSHSQLNINNNVYNATNTYHIGQAYPTDAHYDVYGNLFYVESGQNENGYYFNINVIKFKTNAPEKIPGLPINVSYSIAIDNTEKKVYFGTKDGIYRYNYESSEATAVSSKNLKLNMIFIDKDGNKYITENKDGVEELYLLDGEKKIRFNSLEALNELAIDCKNNFYYIKNEKLYVLKSTHSIPMCIGNVTYAGMAQIAVHNNSVYVASKELVYFHENDTGNLKLVENSPSNVTAIAFDKTGDFILGVHGKILKYEKKDKLSSKKELP